MIKKFFFPSIDKDVLEIMDKISTKGIENISLIVAVFEAIALAIFVLTRKSFGSEEWTSITNVLFCVATCSCGYFSAKYILREKKLKHILVTMLNAIYLMLMSLWGMWASYQRYGRGEQILTFYAVEVMVVCFIALKPWVSTALTISSYIILYLVLYLVDGAAGISIINYFILALVSAIGMGVRYHTLIRASRATVELQKTKDSEIQDKINMLQAIANIYDKVNLIDFVDNYEMSVRSKEQIKHDIDPVSQTHTVMSRMIRKRLMPDQLDRFIEYTNLKTVRSRLAGKRLLSDDFIDMVDGWFRAQYIPVEVDENGIPSRIVFTMRNVDDEKKREERLVRIAMTDELTGLFNRRSYEEDLVSYRENGLDKDFIILSADVNGLKKVNDTIGHAAGDELIKGAADCLVLAIGNKGKVYRTGGDEFIALIHADNPQEICAEIESRVNEWHGKFSESLAISIGVAAYADNQDLNVNELEKKADNEMYHSKARYYAAKGVDRRASGKR